MGRGPGHGEAPARSGRAHGGGPGGAARSTPWCAASARRAAPTWPRWPAGEDPDPVNPNRPNKSIGHEETFSQDLVDPHELERHVLRMAESVATMLRGASSSARTITVKVKFKDLSLQSRSHTLERPIATGGAIGQVAAALLSGVDPGEGIRLLGVSASGLAAGGVDQLSFDLGDGLDEDNHSATAREQSWQDVDGGGGRHPRPLREERGGRGRPWSPRTGSQVPARRDAPWGPDD